jgi:ATP-dependent protease ClpP protease subunit
MPTPSPFTIVQARAASPRAAEVWIYGDIGESWDGESVDAKNFVRDFAAIEADDITVRINSYGGSVTDGLAIHNAIKRHKAKVTVEIDGAAFSIASLIAMAGDDVRMADNALMMIHAPWGFAMGNAAEMRDTADTLDKYASAMSSAYIAKSGQPAEAILALLQDGKDHWFTAAEALAEGFVHAVSDALPIAASLDKQFDLSRYPRFQAAAKAALARSAVVLRAKADHLDNPLSAAPSPAPLAAAVPTIAAAAATQEAPMPVPNTPLAATAAEILAADKSRREGIRAEFAPFAASAWSPELLKSCEDDHDCTAQAASQKILAKLAADVQPVGAVHIETVEDESDKRRDGIVASLVARAGLADKETRARAKHSEFRGAKLLDLARASLASAGIRHQNMDQMQIVAAAFTQSTSDFPVLLENAMYKVLQTAYMTAADTWSRFCKEGSVNDFRANPRYRTGSFGNLDPLNELGEFKNKSISDGEKGSITAGTKGNIINLSRQMVINDDLGAFIGLASDLGRAARRTIESDVYALLALNGGLGPTMEDGKTLFHADHGNIGTGATISVASLDADRVLMGSQTDVSGNDFLDLRPSVLLVPLALGGAARAIVGAEYDDDSQKNQRKPNVIRDLYDDIVDTPRLTGTRRYSFANPIDAPVLEVAFLDGNSEPYLESVNGFSVDGTQWKVRLDYGVGATDYRGSNTNAGVA